MIKRLALVTATAFLAGASGPALATDDGYQNVFSSVLGAVGVLPGEDAPEIDYRERAPLVLPPKQSLVTPQEPGAKRTAAWPVDPDVARRAKAARDARAPRLSAGKNDDRLSKEEQLKYRAAQDAQDPNESYKCTIHDKQICRITPEEEKASVEKFKELNPNTGDTVTAGVEPDRLYLTQPPKGYLKATKTITATHEAPQPKKDDSNPLTSYIQPAGAGKIDPLSE